MARSPLADSLSKVRKRYQRYASRIEREARASAGATSELLTSLADRLRSKAQEFTLKNLRNRYGNEDLEKEVKAIDADSSFALLRTWQQTREEKLGKILLSDKDIASRFYAGTVDIWRGKTGSARDKAILDFFGVDNVYQAIEELEKTTGADILAPSDSEGDPRYPDVKDAIREEVASRLALG